jgi:hypothetical protein
MGSSSALVFGSNVEEQLMPCQTSEDDFCNRNSALHCFYWRVFPPRNTAVDDWRYAFRLKPGCNGDARLICEDDPENLAYSALKRDIDFECMHAEIARGAGKIWDYSREIGIPALFYEYALQRGIPLHDPACKSFDELLSDRIEIAYPDPDDCQFAWAKFVDMKRIIYSRDRYIDLMCKSCASAFFLIEKGVVTSPETVDSIAKIQSQVLQMDAWHDYVYDAIQRLQDDVLISLVYLKQ